MRTLNLGVLAHVDAGKTTLTERLLFEAGVLAEPGSVDAGSTHTDTMALERRRGITIRAAVVSFEVGGTTVNLVDVTLPLVLPALVFAACGDDDAGSTAAEASADESAVEGDITVFAAASLTDAFTSATPLTLAQKRMYPRTVISV